MRVKKCDEVACSICGQYFTEMRHLHNHMKRSHPEAATTRTDRPTAAVYVQHAVDGMPECRYCRRVFTRVEALKKHLQGSCPVLHSSKNAAAGAPAHVDRVPAEPASLSAGLLGHSCRALPLVEAAALSAAPLYSRDDFRAILCAGWKQVLRNAEFCASSRTYCALCGQWASVSGIKQHIRLMHPDAWASKAEAVDRCTSLASG